MCARYARLVASVADFAQKCVREAQSRWRTISRLLTIPNASVADFVLKSVRQSAFCPPNPKRKRKRNNSANIVI